MLCFLHLVAVLSWRLGAAVFFEALGFFGVWRMLSEQGSLVLRSSRGSWGK